jgi:predicted regulator of Ras-like GTPase activity (Roadblock/LC7/MglB family)
MQNSLKKILEMLTANKGVKGALLGTFDGQVIGSYGLDDMVTRQLEEISALSTLSLVAVRKTIPEESSIFISYEQGWIVISDLACASLLVLADKKLALSSFKLSLHVLTKDLRSTEEMTNLLSQVHKPLGMFEGSVIDEAAGKILKRMEPKIDADKPPTNRLVL